ncbi:hypothetical protein ACFL9S_20580 [Erwinia sp. AnSW2-5]|uniref:DUF5862 family protein n=1 Tax=Erwinia sp. AnSW2-5 TaxID=3367692 RepID=UPI00385D38FA
MKILSQHQIEQVNGAWASSVSDSIQGALWGLGDGAMTGMAIAGKYGGGGGWGFGGLAQLVGYAFTPFVGGLIGSIGGLLFGRDKMASVLENYRSTLG